ncbi:MAG: deoxynucleoside kinase [Fibrobacterota bacterium]
MKKKDGGFLSQIHYLAVEGCIGAGKTSFCQILAERLNARTILEQIEENPFIENFYRNKRQYAFQVQLFFLLSRYRQQTEIPQKDLFYERTVSDYMFAKDRIFANLNLSDEELSLYEMVADVLETNIPKPDYIIYLQSSTERLLKNIKQRKRKFETGIDPEYLNSLNESYNHFFFNYTDAPVLIIDASDIDFIKNAEDLDEILRELDRGGKGTRFFKPLAHSKKA